MAYGDNIISSAEAAIERARAVAQAPFAWLTLTERAEILASAQLAEDALHGKGLLDNWRYSSGAVDGWRTCAKWAGTPSWYAKQRYTRGPCYAWGQHLEQALGALAVVVARLQPHGTEHAEVIASTTDQITTAREEATKATTRADDDPGIPIWAKILLGAAVVGAAGYVVKPWAQSYGALKGAKQLSAPAGQADWDDESSDWAGGRAGRGDWDDGYREDW